ncbi:hypothetical protein TELCIR_00532 [Teladorsagia circumcincta]|uniref:Small ribosomal subunit protein mS35 mitochondrial conserved domain-containing protein n=1 Tax=Teladorsagia circumcincta TaxID=45464 RepID=A0A2G9V4M8_TELCI|nr:hypothetical protein TELCIR_00532 [Teladorsagia circumcincta]
MGTRPDPEKRAPFKKQGNLELVKIPNFLHLTPAAIEKHCNAIKKFCTEFPPELISDKNLASSEFPLRISYNTYVHQGVNIRDNRARVITLQVKLSALQLSSHAREKLIRLATNRYDEKTDLLTIITDRCHTRKQNLDYAFYLLTAIFHEANKVEPWEALKEREDSLKVEFEGSETQKKLISVLKQVISHDLLESPLKSRVDPASEDQISSDPGVKEFAQMWNKYVNTEETPESTREYAKSIKALFGIKPPTEHRA